MKIDVDIDIESDINLDIRVQKETKERDRNDEVCRYHTDTDVNKEIRKVKDIETEKDTVGENKSYIDRDKHMDIDIHRFRC